ncbi:MAG: type IX secretion system protein PorQ [Prolixibacteraceae bacterium]|nr:type IX secretion system protein PorQ [Prolixibacteraceae bacterium]
MKLKFYLVILFCFGLYNSNAQIGGENTYQFMELTNSARIAALGGSQTALRDTTDLNLPHHNPALLHKSMENRVLVNYVNYMSDINYGYVSYAKTYDSIGNFALGMHYINYGEFREATEVGELTGNIFNAAEYALNIIYSNQYKRLKYGATLKPILSSFETYQSFGLAVDLGLSFASNDKHTNVALVAQNIGSQITTYYNNGERESIPFNLQAGISRKLMHAPIEFSINMHHINHWDLANTESEADELIDEIYNREESFSKQFMRHLVLGVEILPSPNFTLRAGYNYQRRQELKYEENLSTVGFSFGFGIKIKRFQLDYGVAQYHLAGSSNLFSLAINLNDY